VWVNGAGVWVNGAGVWVNVTRRSTECQRPHLSLLSAVHNIQPVFDNNGKIMHTQFIALKTFNILSKYNFITVQMNVNKYCTCISATMMKKMMIINISSELTWPNRLNTDISGFQYSDHLLCLQIHKFVQQKINISIHGTSMFDEWQEINLRSIHRFTSQSNLKLSVIDRNN